MSSLSGVCLRRSSAVDVHLLQDVRCFSAVTGSPCRVKPSPGCASTSFVENVKPHSRIAQAATIVSTKRWSGGNHHTRGTTIVDLSRIVELHESMSPDELLQECRKLSKTRSARPEGMAQPPPAEAISAACAPLKEYVLNECTGKLVSVIGSLCASMNHWMPGFSFDTLPMICGRMAGNMKLLSVPEIIAFAEILPHSSPVSVRLCNEVAQILLPVRHLLAPRQMASCLCFLGRGTDPAVHELLQHCGNLMTMPQLRQLSLPLLLGCTQAAYCKQLALQPFVANLTSVLETHPDLEKSAMTLHVACHQLVDNGYKLPEALVARYHRCLPPAAALEQMSAERLAQIMAVLSCVPTSAERIGTEQQVAMALLADISKVPKARLVTLLRAAKRSMCHSRALPSVVFAISADPGTSRISLDDFHFVLSSAKSLQVVDRGRVLHWALHVFGAKVQSLTAADIPDFLQCLLLLPAPESRTQWQYAEQFAALVNSLITFTSSQPESLFTMAQLDHFVQVMERSKFAPSISQLRSLFLPRMASSSPAELVSCLRRIHSAFGRSQPEIVDLAIGVLEKDRLDQLEIADLVWMVKYFEECPVEYQITVKGGHQFLLEALSGHVTSGQLSAADLSELGGLLRLGAVAYPLLHHVTEHLYKELASLSTLQLKKFHRIVTSLVMPDRNILDRVQEAVRKNASLSKVGELQALIPMSVSTLHLASIDRLLTEIADGDGMREAKSLLDHASLLPLLYKHGMLSKGAYLGRKLGEEMTRRYAHIMKYEVKFEYPWLLYCISMVSPVPRELLRICQAIVPDLRPLDAVYVLSAYASAGSVPESVRALLAREIVAGWYLVPPEWQGRRALALVKLDFLGSEHIVQLSMEGLQQHDPRVAKLLKAAHISQPSLVKATISSLEQGTPDNARTWCRMLLHLLSHCSEVQYDAGLLRELEQVAGTDIQYDMLDTLRLAASEWMQLCQSGGGVLRLSDHCWQLLHQAYPGKLMFDGEEADAEEAEFAMLLNGVGHVQFGTDRLHKDSVQLLGGRHCRNVSKAYFDCNSHCSDDPSADACSDWSLRSHLVHCIGLAARGETWESAGLLASFDDWSTDAPDLDISSNASAPPGSEPIEDKSPACVAHADGAADSSSSQSSSIPERVASVGEATTNTATTATAVTAYSWQLPGAVDDGSTVAEKPQVLCQPLDLSLLSLARNDDDADVSRFVHGPTVDRRSGILVDAAVALGPNGSLLPFDARLSAENGRLPWGPPEWPQGTSLRMAVCVLRAEHYLRFSGRLRLDVVAKLRILEGLGWTVQTVNASSLQSSHAQLHMRSLLKRIQATQLHGAGREQETAV
eukprot:scpid6409/ scgid10791/ 